MAYVFDSSFVSALVIPDEKNSQVDRMYGNIENDDEIYAPHLIWYEITNVFINLIRSRRFTTGDIMTFYPRLAAMRIKCDNEPATEAKGQGIEYSKKLLRLCSDYNLSSYDAAYLELAERKKAILCTLDKNLRLAAKKYRVMVLR